MAKGRGAPFGNCNACKSGHSRFGSGVNAPPSSLVDRIKRQKQAGYRAAAKKRNAAIAAFQAVHGR